MKKTSTTGKAATIPRAITKILERSTPQKPSIIVTGDENYVGLRMWVAAPGGTIAQVFNCGNPRMAFDDPLLPDTDLKAGGNIDSVASANATLIAHSRRMLIALTGIIEWQDHPTMTLEQKETLIRQSIVGVFQEIEKTYKQVETNDTYQQVEK